jgi:hypothetical protein
MSYRRPLVLALATLAIAASAGFFLDGLLTSQALHDPRLDFDMITGGNTYDETTNTMVVGTVDSCLATAGAGNNLAHLHPTHMIIRNVEDLVGWQARLNYDGSDMRPFTVNFTPFTDNNTGQGISFLSLPIDQLAGVHRDQVNATDIPAAAPGPQTALIGSVYQGEQDFAISPDTPAKTVPDDSSYTANTGGVLATVNLQVLAGNADQFLTVDMDDVFPNSPGSDLQIFTSNGMRTLIFDPIDLGDAFHSEGGACPPDSDGDGVLDANDNCDYWPNPTQNLPPWPVGANDPDCDGFSTGVENAVGTDPLAHCGVDAWPADISNDGFSDIHDISPVTDKFGKSVPPAPARANIAPDPVDTAIDTADIARMLGFWGKTCS